MTRKTVIALAISFICCWQAVHAANVGLLIMATGRYIEFVKPLIASAEEHFCTNHDVTYFVFTDGNLPSQSNVVSFHQKKLGWPFDTLMRNSVYSKHSDAYMEMDYLFACDSDMLFIDAVGDEILGKRVATLSPGFSPGSPFPRTRGDYETNPLSTANVKDDEGVLYYAGGFFGGDRKEFLRILNTTVANIGIDLQNGIIAKVHDESHLNRYFIDNPPTIILSPSYCYPENWKIPYKRRLLALDKNHAEMRNQP